MAEVILRSSSSAFAWGQQIFTDYKTGCLRWILISSHIPYELEAKYQIMGKVNEDRHEKTLKGRQFTRELEVQRDSPINGVSVRGHIDFLIDDPDQLIVDELKHVQSKNVRRDVIRKGRPKTENLAQTVNYMWQARTTVGRLKYSFYEEDTNNQLYYCTEERTFDVRIDDFGRILIDGVATKFTIYDQLAHQAQAATALKEQKILQRPDGWQAPFVSPCAYCPAKSTCDLFDKGKIESTDAFVSTYKTVLASKECENEPE